MRKPAARSRARGGGSERPLVILTLEALPGPAPPFVRLRRLLKAALRCYGFRALSVPRLKPADPDRFEELLTMTTSPHANKFRERFAAGDWIAAGERPPLRVMRVLASDRLQAADGDGRRVVVEHPWEYRKVRDQGTGVREQGIGVTRPTRAA